MVGLCCEGELTQKAVIGTQVRLGVRLGSKKCQQCSWHVAVTAQTHLPQSTPRFEQCISKCPTEEVDRAFVFWLQSFPCGGCPWILNHQSHECTLQASVHQRTSPQGCRRAQAGLPRPVLDRRYRYAQEIATLGLGVLTGWPGESNSIHKGRQAANSWAQWN